MLKIEVPTARSRPMRRLNAQFSELRPKGFDTPLRPLTRERTAQPVRGAVPFFPLGPDKEQGNLNVLERLRRCGHQFPVHFLVTIDHGKENVNPGHIEIPFFAE